MISAEENELLTRVGRGTPMGNLFRQFWIPACLSSELVSDGDPMRLMLLGEKLVAFRDSSGRVGILDHVCPHRCVSLFFGRNEQGGLRCIYHGWKFDADGACVDMPNEPPRSKFAEKIKQPAYPAVERGGFLRKCSSIAVRWSDSSLVGPSQSVCLSRSTPPSRNCCR